jgi:uncharacterized protein YigE (DUF2233 family)
MTISNRKSSTFISHVLPLAAIFIIVFLYSENELAAQAWEELKPGLEKRIFSVPALDGKSLIAINVVRMNTTNIAEIKIINVSGSLIQHKTKRFPVYSLREVISLFMPQVAINGGSSSSYSMPIAYGLLLQDKMLMSRINLDSPTLTGIFCVSKGGFRIIRREEFKAEECVSALQSGPILIEKSGEIAISKDEWQGGEKYRRSVVAINGQGRLFFITSNETGLYDLASFLVKSESEGGLACTAALNLSGGEESGLYANGGESFVSGNIDVPISTAIAVFLKQ